MQPGWKERLTKQFRKDEENWCFAVWGNHDEHQCRLKRGHVMFPAYENTITGHKCYCGVWW